MRKGSGRREVTLSELRVGAEIEAAISSDKCPRRIEIVDDLPKNPSGKIQKREVVRRLGGKG